MIVQDIIKQLEDLAPLAYAEEFDNVGLIGRTQGYGNLWGFDYSRYPSLKSWMKPLLQTAILL